MPHSIKVDNSMLSNKKIECPDTLLNLAKKNGPLKAAIVNAGNKLSMESIKTATDLKLIEPIFIGNKDNIEEQCSLLKWDIKNYQVIDEKIENNTANHAAFLASKNKIQIVIKGNIHTDMLIRAILKKELNLIGSTRLSHVWHMTINKSDKPLLITDGALNVNPRIDVKMHILRNAVNFAHKIGIDKPNIAILSAVEYPTKSIPSSLDAEEIVKRSAKENLKANIYGPLAFDNAVSIKAAQIKNINNKVAGKADIILVPNLETGNSLVKMMIYFMGACAAGVIIGGKIPIVVTSRSDELQSRVASIAAANIMYK